MRIRLQALLVFSLSIILTQMCRADKIDDYIKVQMQRQHIPGLSLAVVKEGKILKAQGYGVANVETATPATENTVYQLASVTKQFTATAIMMLVEEGKIHLDDKITNLLPDLPAAWDAVTVRHLLNHTSGIKSYTNIRDFDKTVRKDYTQRELLALVTKEPMEFAPGEKWNYNNTGFVLLGMLIEKVTGKSYGEFLEERIFKPLGMTKTRVNDLQVIIPNRAHGYSWGREGLRNGEYVSPTQPFSAGALASTVSDMAKWDAALYSDKLVKTSTLDQMWTATPLTKGGMAGYGFGWEVGMMNGHRQISHGGGIPGFSTYISRFVDDKLTIIVLANSDSGNTGLLAQDVAGLVQPDLAKKPDPVIPDPDPQLTERVKGALLGMMRGDADIEIFTEAMKAQRAAHKQEEKEMLAPFGALKSMQLLERREADQGVRLRYRAVFANQTVTLFVNLDKTNKIAGLGLRPE